MGRLLIDPALPEGAKFIDASELAFSLHIKALCYCARALTDGFVPASKPYALVKASTAQVSRALAHLSKTQPGAFNPSWEERPGGWFLHDYDDPEYMNPLRAEVQELTQKRRIAAQKGGLASVKKRMEKYGSAQPVKTTRSEDAPNPTPEANAEPLAEPLASESLEPLASGFGSAPRSQPSKQTSNDPSRSQPNLPAQPSVALSPDTEPGVGAMSLDTRGDNAVLVSNGSQPSQQVQVQHLKGWLYAKHGWNDVTRATHVHEQAMAMHIVEFALPRDELYAKLDAWWAESDPDDRPSSLEYFWTRLQDEQHAHLKQQGRSHVRTDSELAKVAPSIPKGAKP